MLSVVVSTRTDQAGEHPLEIASVVDLTYAAIRERIVGGALPRGARVHQEDLAAELGVSRTPVREALRRLAAEGFVEMRANRGARVAELDRSSMRAAYEARLVIEPAAARIAAKRRPAEPLRRMHDALARQRRAGGGRAGFAANRDFHLALVEAAGNPFLLQTARALWVARVGGAIYEAQAGTPEQRSVEVDEHEEILGALQRGDARAAQTLTRRHVSAAIRRYPL